MASNGISFFLNTANHNATKSDPEEIGKTVLDSSVLPKEGERKVLGDEKKNYFPNKIHTHESDHRN